MKKTYLIFTIASGLFFYGCSNESASKENVEDNVEAIEDHDEHGDDHHHADMDAPLTLNNGEKWEVNEEMKDPFWGAFEVLNMHIEATAEGAQDLDFYHSFANALIEQNTKLINSCTMDGTPHDELHKWLNPHIGLLNDLKNAESVESAEHTVHEIVESYETSREYFSF